LATVGLLLWWGGESATSGQTAQPRPTVYVAEIDALIHPASTTHAQMDAETMKLAGLTEDMIRLSVGLEDIDDIVGDFENGFRAAKKPRLVVNK